MQTRLPKYYRSEATRSAVSTRQITELSLAIIQTIGRYKLLPASLLVRLVPGHRATVHQHLQTLYHLGLINRFYMPRIGYPGEFNYYLDNAAVIDLFAHQGIQDLEFDREELRRNREKAYSQVNDPSKIADLQGRLLYVNHELMISRFHAMIELACRASGGAIELVAWQQGPALWTSVRAPRLRYNSSLGEWVETDEEQRIPVRPDAFLMVRNSLLPAGQQLRSFVYEADRHTTSGTTFGRKLRGHHQFILRQKDQLHIERHYRIKRIRAVLTETISPEWGEHLRHIAGSTMVAPKPSVLFWFTTSTLFTQPVTVTQGDRTHQLPRYLAEPSFIFSQIWASPVDDTLYSFSD